MRAYEFLIENASSGATASGNVASVVNSLRVNNPQSFFGAPAPKTEVTVIRRPAQSANIKEEEKGKKRKKANDKK